MKTITIDYPTLKNIFFPMFKEPIQTEVYFTEDEKGWDVEFAKNSYYVHCRVSKKELFDELPQPVSEEDKRAKMNVFEAIYLHKAVRVLGIGVDSHSTIVPQTNPLSPFTYPTTRGRKLMDIIPKPEVKVVGAEKPKTGFTTEPNKGGKVKIDYN